jgi:hypothetical protein
MGDAPAVLRAAHELLVDMVGCEISGDAGKEIDIALRHRFAEGDALADSGFELVAHAHAFKSSRAMIVRWIWLVPS